MPPVPVPVPVEVMNMVTEVVRVVDVVEVMSSSSSSAISVALSGTSVMVSPPSSVLVKGLSVAPAGAFVGESLLSTALVVVPGFAPLEDPPAAGVTAEFGAVGATAVTLGDVLV